VKLISYKNFADQQNSINGFLASSLAESIYICKDVERMQ